MDTRKIKEQVELIRQVFEYTQRFQGKTFVIKIECSVIMHPYFPILVKDLVLLHRQGIRILLVPGSKERIDEILTRYGVSWETVEGVRISTTEAIPFIKMAAFDVSNRLMTQLTENNAQAVIGNWVRARSMGVRGGVDFQNTGVVEKVSVEVIENVLRQGLVPIFPNIGWNAAGRPYNISSNELAGALATALGAEKLFFITRTAGVTARGYALPEGLNPSAAGVVTHLSVAQARRTLELNREKKGKDLLELIRLGCQACDLGVSRVHIVDGDVEGVVLKEIFSSRGFGTMIYANQHENIRPMAPGDIPEVLRIMQPFVEREILVARSEQELTEQVSDYAVYDVDSMVHGCAAMHVWGTGDLGEIAGVAVDQTYSSFGIGRRLVSYLVERARDAGVRRLFVLTTQTADWFLQLGFQDSGVEVLPPERRRLYNQRRNSRVLTLEL